MEIFWRFVRSNGSQACSSLRFGKSCRVVAVLLGLLTCPAASSADNGAQVTIQCPDTSIELTGIQTMSYDKAKKKNEPSNWNYVNAPASLLQFQVNGQSDTLLNVKCSQEANGVLRISAASSKTNLKFTIWIAGGKIDTISAHEFKIETASGYEAVTVSTQVTYTGSNPTAFFELILFPNLQFAVPNGGTARAMVPRSIGGVLPVAQVNKGNNGSWGSGPPESTPKTKSPFGLFGLPKEFNAMEIAELYDDGATGGGVFFADVNGDFRTNIPPMHFNLTSPGSHIGAIAGYWTALLKPKQPVVLPDVAIGAHASGDWRHAADYYVATHEANTFPKAPPWLLEAGGIYVLGNGGGGSFFHTFPTTPIDDSDLGIALFQCDATITTSQGTKKTTGKFPNMPGQRCLEDVYADAQKLGSNVIYLTGWYKGVKGDYIVHPDLGGAAGLQKAVSAIQGNGGKVILYMESYLVDATSKLASSGLAGNWQGNILPPSGSPQGALPCFGSGSECMAIPNTQWQEYLINRAYDLVIATCVDGFYLDSGGYRMNYPVVTASENVSYTSQQWSAAELRFLDRLRAKIRTAKSECTNSPEANAIVMGENNSGQFPLHWDGGSAGNLSDWNKEFPQNGGFLWGAPIRYASPNANFFANGSGILGSSKFNGTALSSVNQIVAAGYNLALGPFFLLDVTQVGTVTGNTGDNTNPTLQTPSPLPNTDISAKVSGYVKELVTLRNSNKTVKDALIYGTQTPVPVTQNPAPAKGNPGVLAYMYTGSTHQVLTVVNNNSGQVKTVVTTPCVKVKESEQSWQLPGPKPTFEPKSELKCGSVTINEFSPAPAKRGDPMGGLAIFSRSCGSGCAPKQTSSSPTPPVPLMNESFQDPIYALSNWTDWMVSAEFKDGTPPVVLLGAAASNRWSTERQTGIIGLNTVQTAFLKVKSAKDSSLLFYDSFGGGDFTYTGGITFDSFSVSSSLVGSAGLSFRLSDNPYQQPPDAGNQGYDVVLTNATNGTSPPQLPSGQGYVALLKRSSGGPQLLTGCSKAVSLSAGQTYQLSVTAVTKWATSSTAFPKQDPSNADHYPAYPLLTHFKVSIDGTEQFSCKDETQPYFSGRFGVNASNADAHFTCLQANDGQMPLPADCTLIVGTRPSPGQKTTTPDGQRLPP
jgi:hypothetical protein